jgi:hypothetical protein
LTSSRELRLAGFFIFGGRMIVWMALWALGRRAQRLRSGHVRQAEMSAKPKCAPIAPCRAMGVLRQRNSGIGKFSAFRK